ncbi:unnamed protein product [Discula destructiva]
MSSNDLSPSCKDGETSSTRSLQQQQQQQQQPPSSRKPFVTKSNGRTYLSDPTLCYPLPVDLHELHRQSLRTLLLFQLFGGPICSPAFEKRAPAHVLDVGCGYGFWSMMAHSYFSRKGHSNIKFTGIDIAPLGGIAGVPNLGHASSSVPPKDRGSISAASGNWAEQPPDKNMQWNFVQHDLRNPPLPFADEEFDLVMIKEMSLAVGTTHFQACMDEYLRCLKPGGVLEVWDSDHPIRMLRPHVPDAAATKPTNAPSSSPAVNEPFNGSSGSSKNKGDHAKEMSELGAYILGNNTPLSGPQNIYLIEYNSWIIKVLEQRLLLNWPCANIGPFLLQEPLLTNHGSKRVAIPLTEVRWEREGVGGVVTKDGKSYIDTGKAVGRTKTPRPDSSDAEKKGKTLGDAQLALRETALQTVLGMIEALEPALREVSGKKQDEWDAWMGKLRKELMERDGASCGECLEVGAWWSRRVENPS